jgi:hypothetical protein
MAVNVVIMKVPMIIIGASVVGMLQNAKVIHIIVAR